MEVEVNVGDTIRAPKCAQRFLRNKYSIFTMDVTVALRSVNKNFFPESYNSAATKNVTLMLYCLTSKEHMLDLNRNVAITV